MYENKHISAIAFTDPQQGTKWTIRGDTIKWRGHYGVGDFMYGLNTAYYLTNLLKFKVNIDFYWDYDDEYYFHCEDPETILERFDYLHSFFYKKDLIKVKHHLNYNHIDRDFKGELALNLQHGFLDRPESPPIKSNHKVMMRDICSWKFDLERIDRTPHPNKVVIWRPLFNATKPPKWKTIYNNDDWEKIIKSLKDQGYFVVELSYRSPVREAFYHIRTCEFVVAYDGMWQYLTRNLYKPAIMLGDNNVIVTHSPQAFHFMCPEKDKKRKPPINNIHTFIGDLKEKNFTLLQRECQKYENMVDPIIENR